MYMSRQYADVALRPTAMQVHGTEVYDEWKLRETF